MTSVVEDNNTVRMSGAKILRVCANLSMMFADKPALIDRFSAASKAGFKAVELAFPYQYSKEEIAAAKEAAGLEQVK